MDPGACPGGRNFMKLRYFKPLLYLQIPNVVISTLLFLFDEPPKPLQLGGYILFNIFVCVNYWMGIKAVVEDPEP